MKACPSLPTTAYRAGNVRETPLRELLETAPELAFKAGRSGSRGGLWGFCGGCDYAPLCRGGCNWTSHVFFGRRGNNVYCHHRALELRRRGRRERVVLIEQEAIVPSTTVVSRSSRSRSTPLGPGAIRCGSRSIRSAGRGGSPSDPCRRRPRAGSGNRLCRHRRRRRLHLVLVQRSSWPRDSVSARRSGARTPPASASRRWRSPRPGRRAAAERPSGCRPGACSGMSSSARGGRRAPAGPENRCFRHREGTGGTLGARGLGRPRDCGLCRVRKCRVPARGPEPLRSGFGAARRIRRVDRRTEVACRSHRGSNRSTSVQPIG